jgi:HAMP domain-containing protein
VLTDFLRAQIAAYASMPISMARLLAALADAAEASVGVLQQLDERAEATNRVLHSFEDPLVRVAEAVDASLVEQTVAALGRIPAVVARAAALADRADGLIAGLESPVRALGPLTQAIDLGRLGGLVERIEQTLPGLVRLPDAEHEVRRLRETVDRMYRVVDDVQGRIGALPGAARLTGREGQTARGPGRARTAERKERTERNEKKDGAS